VIPFSNNVSNIMRSLGFVVGSHSSGQLGLGKCATMEPHGVAGVEATLRWAVTRMPVHTCILADCHAVHGHDSSVVMMNMSSFISQYFHRHLAFRSSISTDILHFE
jgi:hypothetical protein